MSSLLQETASHLRAPPVQQLPWPISVEYARSMGPRAAIATAGGVFGLSVHWTLFIRGEWHLHSLQIIRAHFALFAALICMFIAMSTDEGVISSSTDKSVVAAAAGSATTLFAVYLSALFASMFTYRGFFHRLGRFPGPVGARFSKFWHVWACRDSRNFQVLDALSNKYGDFVRTGQSFPPIDSIWSVIQSWVWPSYAMPWAAS